MGLSNSNQLKIAFVGKSRAGKDTLARELSKSYREEGKGVVTYAFADGIKEIFVKYFGHLKLSEKPRNAYITIGESFRRIDPRVWVLHLKEKLEKSYQWDVVMVTDLRREVELEYLRKEGFIIVFVEADDDVRVARAEELGETLDLNNKGDEEVDLIDYDISVNSNYVFTETHVDNIKRVIHKSFIESAVN